MGGATTYNENNIKKLTEKEKIQKNIGMYIGSNDYRGVLQLIYEVFSNSIDEYLGGYANQIDIGILPNGAVFVRDNGRGIPIGYKENKKSLIEEIFEVTHMGGKFNNGENSGYTYSGGKHGVGSTVTNYLSSYFLAEVKRDNKKYRLKYKNGNLVEKTNIIEEGLKSNDTGTYIEFLPSKEFLNYEEIKYKDIYALCFRQIFLTKGLLINIKKFGKDGNIVKEETLNNEKGLSGYIEYKKEIEEVKTISNIISLDKDVKIENKGNPIVVNFSFQYTTLNSTNIVGYTNNIYQNEGGKHITALKDLIYNSVIEASKRADKKLPKDYIKDDIVSGVIGIISIKMKNPILEGQTKNKLNDNISLLEIKEDIINKFLSDTKGLDKIIEHIKIKVSNRKAIEKMEDVKIKKVKDPSLDPDNKLVDAETKDRTKAEIFLVEGDSAGGGIKKERNPQLQAIYPLKGKPLNVVKSGVKKTLTNKELKNLIIALGTGIGKNFDISKLRYGKIFIMTDADVDGEHITSLLISFFQKTMPGLLDAGKIYKVIPPLYGIKTKKNKNYYVKDNNDKIKKIKELEAKGEKDLQIIRFKGLGEMDSNVLYETCINPKNRIVEKITNINNEDNIDFVDNIMGDNSKFKYEFLKTYTPEEVNKREKTTNKEIKSVIEESMYDYGMYVNQDRAISYLEDGLKPVHKRILYAMKTKNWNSGGKTVKSAKVVGEVIGTYHPHGDSSVYGASVKMAQDFSLNKPMIFSQGNFGSVFGGGNDFASSRYTEMKLSKYSEDVLLDKLVASKPIVKFRPNYDGTLQEPEYLPSKIPNVLITPTFGMGLGISASIPPHNLTEVCQAMIAVIKNDKADVYEYIKGPDFPMLYNEIIGDKEKIKEFYKGNANLVYRVKIDYDKKTNEIVIKSLPYGVSFDTIFNKIKELVKGEKITIKKGKTIKENLEFSKSLKNEVKKIRNLSGGAGDKRKNKGEYIEIRLELKPNTDVEIVKTKLYKNTDLQKTINYSGILINRFNEIDFYTPNNIIREFIEFRKETLIKYFKLYLEDLNKILLSTQTNLIAIDNIDYIVKTIQKGKDDESIIKKLMKDLQIEQIQAIQILDTKLRNIKNLDKKQIETKIKKIKEEILKYQKLINDKKTLNKYIIAETNSIIKKYGNDRKTEIIEKEKEIKIDNIKMEYEDKETHIFITSDNNIYKTSGQSKKIENRKNMIKEKYNNNYQYLISNNRNKIYFIQDGKGYFVDIGDIKEDIFTPISFYNNKIDNNKKISISLTDSINNIAKDVLFVLDNGNIARVKVKNLIKSTQGFKVSSKKIEKAFMFSLRKDDIIMREYLDEKKGNRYIVFHNEEEFPLKKSVGTGVKTRGQTNNIIKLNIDEYGNILNKDNIPNNEILNITKKEELKIVKKTNKGIKIN